MGAPEANGKAEAAAVSPPATKWYHIDKNFLSIKLIYFWFFASGVSILPLMTLHMTDLGLTYADVAQVYVFMPVASFLGPPVIGYMADRTGRIRELYVVCVILQCVVHQALLFVPPSPLTTPRALAASPNQSTLGCADWPPPNCGSLSRSQDCRLICPDASSRTTFWVYFALRMVGVFFMAPSFTLLDATNLALVRQHKTPGQNFGRQRVTAIAATIIVPPLVGVIIDLVSTPGL
ncbi:uncharacterized protein LOC119105237 [Pollicipes pollicipes]|uniref:uncharacterized protein LOC119105237 n=1 Tax=Pollicipes pollicipes TaxID=41117 RepID=UPI001884A347|nr:uncharacterized protein LOC119105237 [Pollicipes pollicipes]